ncbi:MAG TPA: phosphodiester glycosidase family protein [Pantanalinema sp.]
MTLRWPRWVAIALGAVTWASVIASERAAAAPVAFERHRVKVGRHSWPVLRLRADLADPMTRVAVRFAYGTGAPLRRREAFSGMTEAAHAAALVNGTFFSIRTAETMGTLVSQGRVLQHRDWDDRGTALTIGPEGRARIATLRLDGRPDHRRARFSITSGPRLLRDGKVWLQPRREGFKDPNLFGRHPRVALGLARGGTELIVACFPSPMTLGQSAEAMRALGAHDALNLDGGPSVGMAYRGTILAAPRWGLTNALVLYDSRYPAPGDLEGVRIALADQAQGAGKDPADPVVRATVSSEAPRRSRAPEACHGRLGRTARSGR